MTINRKQKQAVRAFQKTHELSYLEASRLMELRKISGSVTNPTTGITYHLDINGSTLTVWWKLDGQREGYAFSFLFAWMTGYGYERQFIIEGRVKGHIVDRIKNREITEEIAWIDTKTVSMIQSFIKKMAPAWNKFSQSDLAHYRSMAKPNTAVVAYFDTYSLLGTVHYIPLPVATTYEALLESPANYMVFNTKFYDAVDALAINYGQAGATMINASSSCPTDTIQSDAEAELRFFRKHNIFSGMYPELPMLENVTWTHIHHSELTLEEFTDLGERM